MIKELRKIYLWLMLHVALSVLSMCALTVLSKGAKMCSIIRFLGVLSIASGILEGFPMF